MQNFRQKKHLCNIIQYKYCSSTQTHLIDEKCQDDNDDDDNNYNNDDDKGHDDNDPHDRSNNHKK